MRIRWLRTALANLDSEVRYIAQDNPAAAEHAVELIAAAVELLKRHPAMGRPGRVAGTRELVVPATPYLLPYRVRRDVVEVLRVFHGARRWPTQM